MHTAHIRKSDNAHQSVAEHCKSVSLKAKEYSSLVGMSSTCELLGLLHDLGKCNMDFEQYIHGENCFKRGDIDHAYAGAKYIDEMINAKSISNKKAYSEILGHVIMAHHSLSDWYDEAGDNRFEKRLKKTDRYDEIVENLEEIISREYLDDILDQAIKELKEKFSSVMNLCKLNTQQNAKTDRSYLNTCCRLYYGFLERLLESVLVDADRTDTMEFEFGIRVDEKTKNIRWQEIKSNMDSLLDLYSTKTDAISRIRQNISNRCAEFSNHEVDICRLIVPTGGGKTLSSLRFAIDYCKKHDKERIFYIAPFMSILEQNGDIIRTIVGSDNYLEHHSNVVLGIDSEEGLIEYERNADKWDARVIATTMVQFLNTIFSSRMDSVRRFHQLTNAVIIIDEAQAIPDKCVYLFNMAMNFLAKICGSTIVLCTATQPALEDLKYPILLDQEPYQNMTGAEYLNDFAALKRTELDLSFFDTMFTNDEAANFCVDRFYKHGNTLFIVNTKKTAYDLFVLIKEKMKDSDVQVIHLSTHMCPAHRRAHISLLKELLDKDEPVICITTQLIEAGVDISFPCVIRSFSGLDNMTQAAGRCNRNGEMGGISPVYMIKLADEKIGGINEILTAQKTTIEIAYKCAGEDLMQPSVMNEYFKTYYRNREQSLSYKVKDSSMIELLSNNHVKGDSILPQAFKTAGDAFCVIENNTTDVLVPYDSLAEDLISEFYSWNYEGDYRRLLKDAQAYMISVYDHTKKALMERGGITIISLGESGGKIMILNPGFYNEELGICLDGIDDSLIMF